MMMAMSKARDVESKLVGGPAAHGCQLPAERSALSWKRHLGNGRNISKMKTAHRRWAPSPVIYSPSYPFIRPFIGFITPFTIGFWARYLQSVVSINLR